jgi:hypothetical protein
VMKENNSDSNSNRTKIITFRVTPNEYDEVFNKASVTTTPLLSEYIRHVLLQGKVTVFTRNQSLDAFMTELIKLRNELSAIGNNYNQAVKKLNSYSNYSDIKLWLLFNETDQKIFFKKVEQIKSAINQFAESW